MTRITADHFPISIDLEGADAYVARYADLPQVGRGPTPDLARLNLDAEVNRAFDGISQGAKRMDNAEKAILCHEAAGKFGEAKDKASEAKGRALDAENAYAVDNDKAGLRRIVEAIALADDALALAQEGKAIAESVRDA